MSTVEKPTLPVKPYSNEQQITKLDVPPTLNSFVAGIGRVRRDDFARAFDTGIPFMPSRRGNEDVLLLYTHPSSLPSAFNSTTSSGSIPLLSSPEEAIKNCITVRKILIKPGELKSCLAIMGNWPSHHLHTWMREKPSSSGLPNTHEHPLPMTSPYKLQANNLIGFPTPKHMNEAFSFFTNYVSRLDETLDKLRPFAKAAAEGKLPNTVVVMVCNHGQSELLINFVCSARSRGLDVSQALLFATDAETKELGESLGIRTFYDEKASKILEEMKGNAIDGNSPFAWSPDVWRAPKDSRRHIF